MPLQTTRAELDLAWRRYKRDLEKRCFVDHPHMVQWIESDLNGWLDELAAEIATGYTPRPSRFTASPKANHLIRPGTILDPEDAVVYNFAVGRALPHVIEQLKWSQERVDIAYPLAATSDAVEWTKIGFLVWQNWRAKSLAKLEDKSVEYVVTSDITGFYENIDLQRLASDLRGVGADDAIVDLLQKCLRNWALPRNEGIPQGYSASDILAKLYLDHVDRNLKSAGFAHVRYVDDMRVFCSTKLDGRRVIRRLSSFLYPRGLNLQSAKTEILDRTQARRKIDGVNEIIDSLNKKLAAEIVEGGGEYVTAAEVLEALSKYKGPTPEVLERAWAEHFGYSTGPKFDATLFHYLLARLAKVNSRVAVLYCLDILQGRPEETDHVLQYLGTIGVTEIERAVIVEYTASPDAIYDYQLYRIVRWFFELKLNDSELLALCRGWASDQNREPWLRSYAFAYVGQFGTSADLGQLEEAYPEATSDLERADRVAAVSRLEKGRRNAFYARVGGHGKLVQRAVNVAKKHE
jgi:hypothetical protein